MRIGCLLSTALALLSLVFVKTPQHD